MTLHCFSLHAVAAEPVPVIVVGGGAGLCGDALDGASRIIKPPHADVANAVGAAIPQVGHLATYCFKFTLLSCFNVLRTNRGPTDRIQQIEKH